MILDPNSNRRHNLGRLGLAEFCVRVIVRVRPGGAFCVRVAGGQTLVVRG